MNRLVPLIMLLLATLGVRAQHYGWDDFVQDISVTEHDDEEDDQDGWLLYLEELKAIHEEPMNINTATVDELSRLPFLSAEQIEDIHAYIYLHGRMQTLGELRLLRSMDETTRRRLALFVFAGDVAPSRQPLLSYLRHSLSSRIDIPLYYRRGYLVDNGYRGDPLYHRIRYDVENRRVQAGVRIEKDPGERYYDTYGAYAMVSELGALRRLVVGDFRAGFGEGVVMGGSSWNSKTSPTMRELSGLRPMTSMDETRYLRGAAFTIALGREFDVSAFVSYRQTDATLTDEGNVRTLLTTGFHRTASELSSRRNTGTTQVGGHLGWHHGSWHAGATAYMQHFSRSLAPGTQLYRRIYPSGSTFGFAGTNYGYKSYRVTLAGETALSLHRTALATLHRLAWAVNHRYTLSLIQRYYGRDYYSFLATSFSENTAPQNENGVMLHMQAEPLERWQVTAYLDFFHNPWPRYRMTHSSSGQEMMMQVGYQPDGANTLSLRYQLKRKEQADRMEPHHRIRMQWTLQPREQLRMQTTALLHCVTGEWGTGLQETVRYAPMPDRLQFSLTGTYFHSTDYLSRLYFYVPALWGSVVSGTFSGHGLNGALTARFTSRNSRWMVEGRYALVHYFDRSEQSSGLQTIMSAWRNDLSAQVRLRF